MNILEKGKKFILNKRLFKNKFLPETEKIGKILDNIGNFQMNVNEEAFFDLSKDIAPVNHYKFKYKLL